MESKNSIKKIAIVGPESTGKSYLSRDLAMAFNTVWVPEFARQFLVGLGRPYQEKDLETIALGQLQAEEELKQKANKILICDTTLLVIEVWAESAFGVCPAWIKNEVRSNTYDFQLLTHIDLPWEPDPLREHPNLREHFFKIYFDKLSEMRVPFQVVSGQGLERLKNALQHLSNAGF